MYDLKVVVVVVNGEGSDFERGLPVPSLIGVALWGADSIRAHAWPQPRASAQSGAAESELQRAAAFMFLRFAANQNFFPQPPRRQKNRYRGSRTESLRALSF